MRSPNVKKNRVTACEKMGRFARDGGDWHFFPDGTGRDRGVVEVVPHLDKSKYHGMNINTLVGVFRGSKGGPAFVKSSKRPLGLRLRLASILVNVCNMVVGKRNYWVRSGRGHCLSNMNPQIDHGPDPAYPARVFTFLAAFNIL